MGSLDRTSRMNQKSEAEKKVEARLSKLKELGLDDKKIARDPLLRQAKAALKKSIVRLRAIDARDALTQELAARKAKPKVEPKGKADAKKGKPKAEPKAKAGVKKAKPKAETQGEAKTQKAKPNAEPKAKAGTKKAKPKAEPKGTAGAKDAKGENEPSGSKG